MIGKEFRDEYAQKVMSLACRGLLESRDTKQYAVDRIKFQLFFHGGQLLPRPTGDTVRFRRPVPFTVRPWPWPDKPTREKP